MKTTSKYLCRIVSFLGLACSVFCVWYVASAAFRILNSPPRLDAPPHFIGWYVGLSVAAGLIALGSAVGSVELARLRFRGVRLLTICSFLPFPLIMIVGMSWFSPMGRSIAAATGVSLGGLMPMLVTLLPLWAGLLWLLVFRPPQQPHGAATGGKTTTQEGKKMARENLQLMLFLNLNKLMEMFPRQPEKLPLYMQQSLLENPASPDDPEPEPVPPP